MRFNPGCCWCDPPSCEDDEVVFCLSGTGTPVAYPGNPYGSTCTGAGGEPSFPIDFWNYTYVSNTVYPGCVTTTAGFLACNSSGFPTGSAINYRIEYIAGVWTLRIISGTYFDDGNTTPFYVDIPAASVVTGPPMVVTFGPFDIQGSFYDGTTFSWYAYEDVTFTATTEPCVVCCEIPDATETTITIPSGPIAGDYTATWSGGVWAYFDNPPYVLLQMSCVEDLGYFVLSYTYDDGVDFVTGTVPVLDFSCDDPIYFTVPPVP
jgi:hypothetical protein